MDFALLPPEVNSGRMYSGPGSGPMLAAATAWDGLASELRAAAASYGSVISGLSAMPWLGAASAAMTGAAGPYVAWMTSTAAQAEQTAIQAKAAAAAYEVTFAAMVSPPVVEANRVLLQALVATNLFGQNSPAIAATEALYAEMWAQDATAMYGYAGASASARMLTPFIPAPQTTSGAPAAPSPLAPVQPIVTALQAFILPAILELSAKAASALNTVEANGLFVPSVAQAGLTPLNTASLFVDLKHDDSEERDGATQKREDDIMRTLDSNGFHPPEDIPLIRQVMAWGPAEVPSVTAGLGRAQMVGSLSVPSAWTVAAPEIRLAAVTLPAASIAAVPEVMAASPGSLFSEMILANMASRAISGTPTPGRRQERIASVSGARPVSTTPQSPSGHMTAIAADVHEFAAALVKLGDLRDSGLLTDEEFDQQKQHLLGR